MERIGDILVKNKTITKEGLEYALSIQKSLTENQRIGRILKDNNFAGDGGNTVGRV